jgi:hypothetical protein
MNYCYRTFLFLCFVSLSFFSKAQTPLKAQYDFSATNWEAEALPLGNGFNGAMVFGGVMSDMIQVNEHTLWSGGPGKNPNYSGGHNGSVAIHRANYQRAREALQKEMNTFSETRFVTMDANGRVTAPSYPSSAGVTASVNLLKGTKNDFGSYQSLGNIHITYSSVVVPKIVNITGDCDNPTHEKYPALFDNSETTKWFADQGFKAFPCYVAWEYAAPFSTGSYTLISGNDMPGRDPRSWKLYGSNNGTAWTEVDSRTNVSFTDRRQHLTFKMASTVTYKHYKFEISATGEGLPPQLSEIALDNASISEAPPYSNYLRELDIDNAVASVSYTQDGVNFKREYFISNPDRIMAIRLSADKPASLSRTISITTPQERTTIAAASGVITMEGRPADHNENGLKFAQQIKVIPTGGTMTTSDGEVTVENANEILILATSSSNYQQCMDETFNYFSTVNPLTTVQGVLTAASAKTFAKLKEDHIADYKSLYDRMSLNLTNAANTGNKTTDKLLAGYKNNSNTVAENLYLEKLYYQFGRYLLISSSRQGGLPANLQGIWAEGLNPPWSADYHTNINVQMNYWLAEQTNLAECHLPLIEYTKAQVPRGRKTAEIYHSTMDGGTVRGWTLYHENNIWGNTGPATSDAFYFPAAGAWMAQHIWEHYLFNQDEGYLREYYPILLEAALFWVDNLWKDERDGTLVASPGYSPEHGPYSLGTSTDQAIITEIFDIVLKAYGILNEPPTMATSEILEIKTAKNRLAGPQIGLGGQFMEWKDEVNMDITGDGGHRHVNHLHWLHPGSQIIAGRSPQEDLFVEAMRKTLNTRGDGGTGWSMAWKINFWARLRDGDRSHKLVQEILKNSTLTNLFDTHPPFQIDGNFGATSGMTEMLVQSQGDCIEMLPALPAAWNVGSFKGVKARGNFELDAAWDAGKLTALEITSNSGKECVIKYAGIENCTITQKGGGSVTTTVVGENKISFPTTVGTSYIVNFQ